MQDHVLHPVGLPAQHPAQHPVPQPVLQPVLQLADTVRPSRLAGPSFQRRLKAPWRVLSDYSHVGDFPNAAIDKRT